MVMFYLGTHVIPFTEKANIPWFISCKLLLTRNKRIPGVWMMDSGGFTEIAKYGRYTITEAQYLNCILRLNPGVAFCQDWMCEDSILRKTGLTIVEHQTLTTNSYLALSKHSPVVMPVLQGVTPEDYVNHLHLYKQRCETTGLLFGLGSVCRRRDYREIEKIVCTLNNSEPGIKLHGFGVKTTAFKSDFLVRTLYSADSMAWSFSGRYAPRKCGGCKKLCQNCFYYSIQWYGRVRELIEGDKDDVYDLFGGANFRQNNSRV